MKRIESTILKSIISLSLLALIMLPANVIADDVPKGEAQVWTSIEGNIKYYVKVGDKVKKGTPLFYISNCDNDPAHFWNVQHKIDYYKKLYKRRAELVSSHAVSQEEVDNALQNLIEAEDELTTLISLAEQGFYRAPFDCEITKLLYLQGSGIGDGNPAINIKNTDKNYKFEPPKPDPKLLEIINKRDSIMEERKNDFDVSKIDL